MRRKMWREVGGRSEYENMPLGEQLELRLSLKAEIDYQVEQNKENKEKQAEADRKREELERKLANQRGYTR